MTTETIPPAGPPAWRKYGMPVAAIILIGAMVLDTRIVVMGSAEDVQEDVFNPDRFGAEMFPGVRDYIVTNAVDAATLAPAVMADKAAAAEEFGTPGSVGAVMPVTVTGVAGDVRSGIYTLAVAGIPEEITVRVQTGPAINGTELRDVTGEIVFGQFTNQIEYQDAGAALNNQMKVDVLADVDTATLGGKTITVTGAFRLINPKNWLITPVTLEVK
ncbi:Predicted lipoprotein [Jannaschia faecimaris]|uniref:Predicted lipoprotein n=1 Tax=Jannaschia faecimaris TaxID=1244108 RepID=A0A1H3P5G3_9RHOB|nr:DUF2291 domain-containing protein [Jannaschia faecimaris]SDY96366.1 Predicted lipoprotein [Jannaschia faecimaris]